MHGGGKAGVVSLGKLSTHPASSATFADDEAVTLNSSFDHSAQTPPLCYEQCHLSYYLSREKKNY